MPLLTAFFSSVNIELMFDHLKADGEMLASGSWVLCLTLGKVSPEPLFFFSNTVSFLYEAEIFTYSQKGQVYYKTRKEGKDVCCADVKRAAPKGAGVLRQACSHRPAGLLEPACTALQKGKVDKELHLHRCKRVASATAAKGESG